MTAGAALASKDIRALGPTWAVTAVVMGAALVAPTFETRVVASVAYCVGAAALGALSFGHEYANATMGVLLSQPVSRGRLLFAKMAVLAVMVTALAALGMAAGLGPLAVLSRYHRPTAYVVATMALPALCGLCLAPWLTIVCRGGLAGLVFTLATPATCWLAGEIAGIATLGSAAAMQPAVEVRAVAVLCWATLVLSLAAAVSLVRDVARLEVVEGRGRELRWPGWRRSQPPASVARLDLSARRRSPWLGLVKKELRLQTMTFLVSGLYIAAWAVVSLLKYSFSNSDYLGPSLPALAGIYGVVVALMTGSLASAEERLFGTLEWQALLPIAAWRQWLLKAAMAIGLASALAIGLPALLASLYSQAGEPVTSSAFALVVITLTVGALYVSSLSGSGIRALLASLPVMAGVLGVALAPVKFGLLAPVFSASMHFFTATLGRPLTADPLAMIAALEYRVPFVLWAGLVALVLSLALLNHRSAERGALRAWRQWVWMGGYVVIGAIAWASVLGAVAAGTAPRPQPGNPDVPGASKAVLTPERRR